MIPTFKGWPFPLPLEALEGFVHPVAGSVFAQAHWHDGEVWACNGHVALRAVKGAWMAEDFAPAGGAFVERFEGLPWDEPTPGAHWREFDALGRLLFRYPAKAVFAGGKLAACAAVRVAGVVVAPLSLLQLVAGLPRCELWAGPGLDRESVLAFRFSGGRGLIGNHEWRDPAFSIFEPQRHEDGARADAARPVGSLALPGWPPVDTTAD